MNDNINQYSERFNEKKEFIQNTPYQTTGQQKNTTTKNKKKINVKKVTFEIPIDVYDKFMEEVLPDLYKQKLNGEGRKVTFNDGVNVAIAEYLKRRDKKNKEISNK